MSQIFHPSFNTIARASIFGAIFIVAAAALVLWQIERSSYVTEAGIVREQPVPFSHEHHVKGLGIDCRYCHTSAKESPFAGVPPTKTCITCHSQIWTNAALLQPVRDSWRQVQPIQWNRVNNVPSYVYFNHSIHVSKGVGCSTCHGPVNQMPLTWQHATLQMEWCLDCHRQPEKYLRPREEVFNMDYQPPADQWALGRKLVEQYHIRSKQLLQNCSTCHR